MCSSETAIMPVSVNTPSTSAVIKKISNMELSKDVRTPRNKLMKEVTGSQSDHLDYHSVLRTTTTSHSRTMNVPINSSKFSVADGHQQQDCRRGVMFKRGSCLSPFSVDLVARVACAGGMEWNENIFGGRDRLIIASSCEIY